MPNDVIVRRAFIVFICRIGLHNPTTPGGNSKLPSTLGKFDDDAVYSVYDSGGSCSRCEIAGGGAEHHSALNIKNYLTSGRQHTILCGAGFDGEQIGTTYWITSRHMQAAVIEVEW